MEVKGESPTSPTKHPSTKSREKNPTTRYSEVPMKQTASLHTYRVKNRCYFGTFSILKGTHKSGYFFHTLQYDTRKIMSTRNNTEARDRNQEGVLEEG